MNSVISDTNAAGQEIPTGMQKVGPGELTLGQNDTYAGTNTITQGVLNVQASGALGLDDGQEVQRITTVDPLQKNTFQLSFQGQSTPVPTSPLALPLGASPATVATAINALSTVAGSSAA